MRLLSSTLSTVRSASMSTMSATATRPRDSQVLTLPDGRRLGYAEYGSPTGTPVLYFHGFPSARLEAFVLERLATRRNIRLLSLDRPGFGLSTFQPGRRLLDWPADVRAFAGQLDLGRFAVLGCSGGGPYAVACARHLPSDMLTAVGVLAGGPPHVGPPKNDYLLSYKVAAWAARWAPWPLRVLSDGLVGAARWLVSKGPVTRWIDGLLGKLREAEAEKTRKAREEGRPVLVMEEQQRSIPESREMLLRGLFEAFTQGAGPMVQEMRLLSQDWGIRFQDVVFNPILIWHGSKDKNAPIRNVRWMAEQLPHARLVEFDKDTHFNIHEHLEEVFDDFLAEIERKEAALKTS